MITIAQGKGQGEVVIRIPLLDYQRNRVHVYTQDRDTPIITQPDFLDYPNLEVLHRMAEKIVQPAIPQSIAEVIQEISKYFIKPKEELLPEQPKRERKPQAKLSPEVLAMARIERVLSPLTEEQKDMVLYVVNKKHWKEHGNQN